MLMHILCMTERKDDVTRIIFSHQVRLARSLLKEAQRDMQRRQRERERLNKQKQLEELKERKMAAKRRIQELTSFPIPSEKREVRDGHLSAKRGSLAQCAHLNS